MEDKLKCIKILLEKYQQEHLLQFYEDLDIEQKNSIIEQILSIDFEEILSLYHKSKLEVLNSTEEVEPLSYFSKDSICEEDNIFYSSIGEKAIASGELGIITLAGGQGSRLGFKGPKGTFSLDTQPKISLFEILCNYIKSASIKYKVKIPWYIMTSIENNDSTIEFFKANNFFGYDENCIIFFTQDVLPLIDVNGKLVLSEIYQVKEASNGNGNLFSSLKRHNLVLDMKKRNIKWLFVGGVDNVLLDPLDSLFIGLTVSNNTQIASKTLFKQNPEDTSWVFATKNNRPAIVDCENFVSELSRIKDKDGNYLYRETNMLAHLFDINAIETLSNLNFAYHRAFRKSPFINSEGMKQVPDSPNIYKFEQFVFDAFSHFDRITLLRVNTEKEFSPIKDFNGPYNPEIAQEKYEKYILKIKS